MIFELTEIYITPRYIDDTSPATLDFSRCKRVEPPPPFKGEKPAKRKRGPLTKQDKQSITAQTLKDAEEITEGLGKWRKIWTEHSKKGTAGLLDAVDPCAPVFRLFLTALVSFPRCVVISEDGQRKIDCIGAEALRPDANAPSVFHDDLKKVLDYLRERNQRGCRPFCDAVDDIKTVLSRCITDTARDKDTVRAVVEAVSQVDLFVESFLEDADAHMVCNQLVKMRHAFLEVKKAVAVHHRKTMPLPNTMPTFKRATLLPSIIAESDGSVRSKHRRKMTQKESDKAVVKNLILDEYRKLRKNKKDDTPAWLEIRDTDFTYGTCTAKPRDLFKNVDSFTRTARKKNKDGSAYHFDTQRQSAVTTFSARKTT